MRPRADVLVFGGIALRHPAPGLKMRVENPSVDVSSKVVLNWKIAVLTGSSVGTLAVLLKGSSRLAR